MNRNTTLRHAGQLAALWLGTCSVVSADVVLVAPNKPNDPPVRRTGEIVNYTGKGLILNAASGRTVTLPADKILHVETDRCKAHRNGDAARMAGRFDQALDFYNTALRDREERRRWVRRRIVASTVACLHALGQHEKSCKYYVTLLHNDPDSPHQRAAPLAWGARQRVPVVQAQTWLSDDVAWIRLLGVSYLLATDHRASALAVLDRLELNESKDLARWAAAQRWRTQVTTATQADVDGWADTTDRMPTAMRAGPYAMMGRARAALGQHQEAALLSMRVPILYAHERQLGAEALLTAAKSLVRLNRPEEADRIFSELIQDHAQSTAAAEAKQRLETLRKPPENSRRKGP